IEKDEVRLVIPGAKYAVINGDRVSHDLFARCGAKPERRAHPRRDLAVPSYPRLEARFDQEVGQVVEVLDVIPIGGMRLGQEEYAAGRRVHPQVDRLRFDLRAKHWRRGPQVVRTNVVESGRVEIAVDRDDLMPGVAQVDGAVKGRRRLARVLQMPLPQFAAVL